MSQRSMRLATPLPLIVTAVVLVMQLVSPSRVWSWLLTGLITINVVGYVWARLLRDGVAADRRMQGTWLVAGDILEEQFTLHNRSPAPVMWAEVVDESNVPGYSGNRVEVGIWPGDVRKWRLRATCRRRGLFTIGPWELHMGDPLGLFRITLRQPHTETVLVYPRVMHLPALDLPRGAASGPSRSTRPSVLTTVAASSVRDYVSGDALRAVHWPTTAHHDRLMVREFDLDPSGNLWIVLDMDRAVQVGEGAESTEEYGIIMAASLAAEMLRQNRAVGLCVTGEAPLLVPPKYGLAQLWKLLNLLATASARADCSLANALWEIGPTLSRGLTLAIITPSSEPTWIAPLLPLARRGIAASAILLDGGSFSEESPASHAGGLAALRSALADQGVPSHVISQGFPFSPMIPHRRTRVVQKVLWGTGRVVTVEVEEEV